MFGSTESVTAVAVVFLWTCSLCKATVDTTATNFTKGKQVATSYMTLQSYSDIQCVRACFGEKRLGRCSVAGYHSSTKTCYLSNNHPHNVLNTADDEFGVFFYSTQKVCSALSEIKILHATHTLPVDCMNQNGLRQYCKLFISVKRV